VAAVISLDHPFGPAISGQRGGYFDTELVSDTWRKADVEVTQQFWRRPLAAALGAFADAGFMVDRVARRSPRPKLCGFSRMISARSREYRRSSSTGCGFSPSHELPA
jgi:hypothetical protein